MFINDFLFRAGVKLEPVIKPPASDSHPGACDASSARTFGVFSHGCAACNSDLDEAIKSPRWLGDSAPHPEGVEVVVVGGGDSWSKMRAAV